MRGKKYSVLTFIAMITVALAIATMPVKASPYVNFYVKQDLGYIPGVDPVGEYIYSDVTVSGSVSAGDIRLTPVGPYAAGSTVAEGESDIGKVLRVFRPIAAPYERHRENIAVNNVFDYGEYIYRDVDYTTNPGVSVGDIRYTAVPPYNAGSTVAEGDADIGETLVGFKTTTPAEKHTENIEADMFYTFAKVFVDVYVENDLPDYDPGGMVGWGVIVEVDPRVLIPYSAVGSKAGYYLYDFYTMYGLPYASLIVTSKGADYLDVAEMLTATPPDVVTVGAGDTLYYDYPRLCTLVFIPLSETAYSPLHIRFVDKDTPPDGISDDWMTLDGLWHPATLIDGQYNFVVPEFPLGIGIVFMLAPAIPIVYLWRTRKRSR